MSPEEIRDFMVNVVACHDGGANAFDLMDAAMQTMRERGLEQAAQMVLSWDSDRPYELFTPHTVAAYIRSAIQEPTDA